LVPTVRSKDVGPGGQGGGEKTRLAGEWII